MSNLVEQIRSGITTIITTNLSGYNSMRFVQSPERNDSRTIEKSYGVRALSASFADNGVLKTYTLDHDFEVILARRYIERDNDDNLLTVIDDLFNQADTIFVKALGTKLSLPTIVSNVHSPTLSEPEVLDNSIVLLRIGFTVNYRNTLNP
jgi:hypothetical protein